MTDSDKLRMPIVTPKAIINTITNKKYEKKLKKLIVQVKMNTYVKWTDLSKLKQERKKSKDRWENRKLTARWLLKTQLYR